MTRPLRPAKPSNSPSYPVFRAHWRTQAALWTVAAAAFAAAACLPEPIGGEPITPTFGYYHAPEFEDTCVPSLDAEQELVASDVCNGEWHGDTVVRVESQQELLELMPCGPVDTIIQDLLVIAEEGTAVDFETESVLVTVQHARTYEALTLSSTEQHVYITDTEAIVRVDAVDSKGGCLNNSGYLTDELLVSLSIVPKAASVTDCTRQFVLCDWAEFYEAVPM